MEEKKKLPVGIENFDKIRTEDFYYIDKTGLIEDLLKNWGEVNLFTRPRRFGKSLNMSMLRHFFEPGCDKTLFEGLKISKNTEFCEKYMGQYPVISVSLKGVLGGTYETAGRMLNRLINEEAYRIQSRMQWEKLPELHQKQMKQLLDDRMDEDTRVNALRMLSSVMHQYYGQKVIILIDEYDVPLDKSFQLGYYDQMVMLISNLFAQSLKTNDSLFFAVVTGCLRIAKESIFTGLNNLKVFSVMDARYDEYFGFTDGEVRKMLEYYGLTEHFDAVKEWYDGYHIGNTDVYCPWDVICYCSDLQVKPSLKPRSYWINTSGNSIIRRFIGKADRKTRRDLEDLVAGKAVRKTVRQELTYHELDDSIDNLWSVLFLTGYLTMQGEAEGRELLLVIPNLEIRDIFVTQIQEWFQATSYEDKPRIDAFCQAFRNGDAEAIEEQLGEYLKKTISIRDTSTKSKKENFYHGILLGLLNYDREWIVSSNAESGDGYSDILIEMEDEETGIVIEVKYADDGDLDRACQEALRQTKEKNYTEKLFLDEMNQVMTFGIACYRKRCRVMRGE